MRLGRFLIQTNASNGVTERMVNNQVHEAPGMTWLARNRRKAGIGLMVCGLVPWSVLMVYIVYIRTPSSIVIGATIFCWLVFFAGKTILKDKGYIRPTKD